MEGHNMPLFLRLSEAKFFLWWTNHMKNLIFIQSLCFQSFCQVLLGAWGSISRRKPLASLMLKFPSLLLPNLSWSCPSVTKIILWSSSLFRDSALLLRVLSSLPSILFQILHFPTLCEFFQKYFTFTNPWLLVSCSRPKNYSFSRFGSCFHFSC